MISSVKMRARGLDVALSMDAEPVVEQVVPETWVALIAVLRASVVVHS